jgi:hypothetical protein
MYKVEYKNKPEEKLKLFINSYKNIYLETFTDTWLFYEDLIRQNYINISEKFFNEIIDFIDDIFSQEKIYWYSVLENKNYQIKTKLWNFRIFVEYTENNIEKIRFIENIEFYKK